MDKSYRIALRIITLCSIIFSALLILESLTIYSAIISVVNIYIFWIIFRIFFDDPHYRSLTDRELKRVKRKQNTLTILLATCSAILLGIIVRYFTISIEKDISFIYALLSIVSSFTALLMARFLLLKQLKNS